MICKTMKRLTTDNPKGNLESMLNFAIAKNNKVFLADENGEYNVDLCEYVSRLAKAKGYDFSPKDIMEEGLFEYYEEDFTVLYYLAVQAAELRERLKFYEDKLENGTLIEVDENYHTHICKAKGLVNGFSIFARVVDETDDTVTIERYQEFGALKIRNITISKEDFERYYKRISEVQCFLPKKKPKQG